REAGLKVRSVSGTGEGETDKQQRKGAHARGNRRDDDAHKSRRRSRRERDAATARLRGARQRDGEDRGAKSAHGGGHTRPGVGAAYLGGENRPDRDNGTDADTAENLPRDEAPQHAGLKTLPVYHCVSLGPHNQTARARFRPLPLWPTSIV